MEIADHVLISGIKRDDYRSYNQLFIRYYNRLCLFVFKLTQSYSASEDIVQDLMTLLWEKDTYFDSITVKFDLQLAG